MSTWITMSTVLSRWANARGFAVEGFTITRGDLVTKLAGAFDAGQLTMQIRPGMNEGIVIEIGWSGYPIARAKMLTHDVAEASAFAGALFGALANYHRRTVGGYLRNLPEVPRAVVRGSHKESASGSAV